MTYTITDDYISGFLQGFGLGLMCVGFWLKYNKDYILIHRRPNKIQWIKQIFKKTIKLYLYFIKVFNIFI
jgi:hypothetical protein